MDKLAKLVKLTNLNYNNINKKHQIFIKEVTDEDIDYLPKGDQIKVYTNQKVDYLPNTLKKAKFGQNFNQKLDYLPNSIVTINLAKKLFILGNGGQSFHKIDYLPNSIKFIKLESNFNQKIDYLPNSIELIKFGSFFNQKIDYLPNSVKVIQLGFHYQQNIDHLPNSLQKLIITGIFWKQIDYLPNSLKFLSISTRNIDTIDYLPSNLAELSLNKYSKINYLPKFIKKLSLNYTKFCQTPIVFNRNNIFDKDISITYLYNKEVSKYPVKIMYQSIISNRMSIPGVIRKTKPINYINITSIINSRNTQPKSNFIEWNETNNCVYWEFDPTLDYYPIHINLLQHNQTELISQSFAYVSIDRNLIKNIRIAIPNLVKLFNV